MLNNKGIALFLVLWILALLCVIVGEFCHTMRTGIYITRNFKEQTQAYYIAKAGINIALSELVQNEISPLKKKDETEEDEETIDWRINADIPEIVFGQGKFKIHIDNESGKININQAGKSILKMMLNKFDLDDEQKEIITDSILDWRDKDDLHRLNGAENKYYQALPDPYDAKNRNFDSIEELLLVRGMKPEFFYEGLKDMVTVYPKADPDEKIKKSSKKENKNKYNFNKININAASFNMLKALPLMTDELAHEIIEYRKQKDFKSVSQLLDIVGDEVYQSVYPYLSLQKSSIFTIKSIGTISDSKTIAGVQAVLEIDAKFENKFRIIQWLDNLKYYGGLN